MSYDLSIYVIAKGCDMYVCIGRPELDSPTYNLGKMFRECMDWDFSQTEKDENGDWQAVYYPCTMVLEKVNKGLTELILNDRKYKQYEPENGWGSIRSAINTLESLRDCINKNAERIPIECLYMSW